MWCYNFTSNNGLLLLICIFSRFDLLASSTTEGCKLCDTVQNAKSCSKTKSDCLVVCNDGYWGDRCQFGRIRLTGSRGYITDGFRSYTLSSKRVWFIDVGNRTNANIHFQVDEFFTECNWDHLYIFDGDSTDSLILAAFNGFIAGAVNSSTAGWIPQEIVAKSGRAYVYFYSDPNVVKTGFNISYRIIDNCHCLNGKCDTAGLCVCDVGWSGRLCDVKNNCSCVHGVCNQTLGNCVCNDGFAGNDCSRPITSSYWTNTKSKNSDVKISPRSSHAAAIIGNHMWVYNGHRFTNPTHGSHKNLYRYNLQNKTWTSVLPEEDDFTWGHSMIAYQGKLFVFGGEKEDQTIVNTLSVFDTNSSKWSPLKSSPQAVTGHTATLVGDKMIVIFGLSTEGLFPGVQEYHIGNSTWELIQTKTAFGVARHGHTSVYDSFSKRIYVYGGVKMTISTTSHHPVTDSLMAYYPDSRSWITLASSGFRQTLHSAVILDRMMIVFGGNPYIGLQTVNQCHTTKFHVYDLACQKWLSKDLPQVEQTLARYGHSAVAKGRTMYIFGGFNGALFNDVLTYTHGECGQIMNETECIEKYFTSGCFWNNSQCVNKDSLETLSKCPGQHEKSCSKINHCDECQSHPKCDWIGNSCKVTQNGSETCAAPSVDICPFYSECESCKSAGCYWASSKCQRQITSETCNKSCTERKSSKECLDKSSCLWCENLKRCVNHRLYAVYYPYGQCFEWVTPKSKDKDVSCESKRTCRDCRTLPQCGWSENEMKDGTGRCLQGGARGPRDAPNWHFFDCPLCQCNGHSNCSVNSSVCLDCRDHTTGRNCEKCAPGYFGEPSNGGKCEPCQCNGHADTCDDETGKCQCRMKGVSGNNCETCKNQYVGNATNGGYCYYRLLPDYLYKINVSNKLIFNFICAPNESDRNTVVTVNIVKGNPLSPALLNVSIDSDTMDEVFWITNVELSSQYEEKFSKDDFSFGSNHFNFKIYVYNLTPYSVVSISVHQPSENGINLLKFFIIFLACFVSLLIFAVIFWKAKTFFDTFRRTRRRNVELVYMTNRPFASVPICIEKPGHVPMKNKPTLLTSEVCYGNKAAVATVLVRLPLCAQEQNSTGAASLCLGSTLVNFNEHQGSKMVNYMKNIKRRRNPFRSSAI